MALYWKLPLTNGTIRFLNYDQVPTFETTVTLPSGQSFQLVTVHSVAPVPGPYPTNIEDGERGVALLKAGRLVARQPRPVLLAGDFNNVGWSHNTRQFAAIGGLNDVRTGRGLYSTFDARSLLWRWPLD